MAITALYNCLNVFKLIATERIQFLFNRRMKHRLTAELKTVHSFWTPLRILDKLKRTTEEIEKEQGIKISPNQLAMNLLDIGLQDETLLNRSLTIKKEAPPMDAVVELAGTQRRPMRIGTTTTTTSPALTKGGDVPSG